MRASPWIANHGSQVKAAPKPRGFTLLEMLLALVLLAVGTIALVELLQKANQGIGGGENVLIATQLAQSRMEELRNTAYSSLSDESAASISSPSGFTRFTREVDVTQLHSDTLRQIDVTVSWAAPGGTADVTLQNYRSDTR